MVDAFSILFILFFCFGMVAVCYQVVKYVKRTDYILKRLEDIYGSYLDDDVKEVNKK